MEPQLTPIRAKAHYTYERGPSREPEENDSPLMDKVLELTGPFRRAVGRALANTFNNLNDEQKDKVWLLRQDVIAENSASIPATVKAIGRLAFG